MPGRRPSGNIKEKSNRVPKSVILCSQLSTPLRRYFRRSATKIMFLIFLISFTILTHTLFASSYMATSDADSAILNDYSDMARLMYYAKKRSCLKRGMSCDHRPTDCCYNSSCRCNLWGTNCRCQRMGLFQKWGK